MFYKILSQEMLHNNDDNKIWIAPTSPGAEISIQVHGVQNIPQHLGFLLLPEGVTKPHTWLFGVNGVE